MCTTSLRRFEPGNSRTADQCADHLATQCLTERTLSDNIQFSQIMLSNMSDCFYGSFCLFGNEFGL